MTCINPAKVAEFRVAMTSQGKQKSTVESYARDMANFFRFIELLNVHSGDIGLDTIEEFKNWMLSKGAKHSSIRRAVIAIRMFFRWLEEAGDLHGNPIDEAPVPAHENHAARIITNEKIDLMMNLTRAGDSALKSARDTLLLLLLCREGLKSSEIINLKWNHFFAAGDAGRLTVPGERSRTIGLESETTNAFKHYRKMLQTDTRTANLINHSSHVFVSFKGADARVVQSGITRHGLKFAIYEMGAAAEISHLNAELLRHVAMSHKIALGYSPDMLMNHLGLRRVGNIGQHIKIQP